MEVSAPGRKEPFRQAGPQDSTVPFCNPTRPTTTLDCSGRHPPSTYTSFQTPRSSKKPSPIHPRLPPQTRTSREQPQPEESPHRSHGPGHASRGQRQARLLKSICAPTHRHPDRHADARTRSRTDRDTNALLGAARPTHRGGAGWEGQGLDCGRSEGPVPLPPLPAPVGPALPAAPPHVPRLLLSPRWRRRRTRRTGRREGPGRGCGPAGGGGGPSTEDPPTARPPPRRPRPPPRRPRPPRSPYPAGLLLELPPRSGSGAWESDPGSSLPDPGQLPLASLTPPKRGAAGLSSWAEVPSRKGS